MNKVDYNKIAHTYNERYEDSHLADLTDFLVELLKSNKPQTILETGCGTGHWLNIAKDYCSLTIGADSSIGMLKVSGKNSVKIKHICADADNLPLKENYFDLIMVVNSFHFYKAKADFICKAHKLLKRGGCLFIYGLDPHHEGHEWYLHKYFKGIREFDFNRFQPTERIMQWFRDAGFVQVQSKNLELIHNRFTGSEVLDDKFLRKDQASQLAALSDEEYNEGIQKITYEINNASVVPVFKTDLLFTVVTGRKL